MKPVASLLLLLLIPLIAGGCGKSLQSKITGEWEVAEGEDLFEMMDDDASSSKFQLSFLYGGQFKSKVRSSGFEQEKTGRWFFLEASGDICKIRVTINSNNSNIEADNVLTEIKVIDENTIELIPPNMDAIKHKMRFKRQQP